MSFILEPSCHSGWTGVLNRCMKVYTSSKTNKDAINLCANEDSSLVGFTTQAQWDEIKLRLSLSSGKFCFFLVQVFLLANIFQQIQYTHINIQN